MGKDINGEWIKVSDIIDVLTPKNLTTSTNEAKTYTYYNNSIVIINDKAKMGDALEWQEISNRIPNYTFPLIHLILNRQYCVGYITPKIEGLIGCEWFNKLKKLEDRKIIANAFVDFYLNIKSKNLAYTNWNIEDLIITTSKKIKLINPQFFVDIQQYPEYDNVYVDYNFCVLIFSVLYGLDFTIIHSEEIPDLNIPEAIKDILSKKKNEKITIEEIQKTIRLTQKEFVYQPQIQELIRKFPISTNTSNN